MRRLAVGLLLLASGVASAQEPSKARVTCKEFHGYYGLDVGGSNRLSLDHIGWFHVSNNKLDQMLNKVGRRYHDVYGMFTVCAPGLGDRAELNDKSGLFIKSFRDTKFVSHI